MSTDGIASMMDEMQKYVDRVLKETKKNVEAQTVSIKTETGEKPKQNAQPYPPPSSAWEKKISEFKTLTRRNMMPKAEVKVVEENAEPEVTKKDQVQAEKEATILAEAAMNSAIESVEGGL